MAFKDTLKALLTERNMKAVELSRLSGVSETSISEYLHGKKEPMINQAKAISKALGVTLDILFETEDEKQTRLAKIQDKTQKGSTPMTFTEQHNDLVQKVIDLLKENGCTERPAINVLKSAQSKIGRDDFERLLGHSDE